MNANRRSGFLSAAFAFFLLVFVGCSKNEPSSLSAAERQSIADSARAYMAIVSQDVTREGPAGWLRHFKQSPEFFMASDGRLLFPDADSAMAFTNQLKTQIRSLVLDFNDIRVDPLSPTLSVVGAGYTERIEMQSGNVMPIKGYFTATIENTSDGMRFRNMHWSLLSEQTAP